MSATGVSIRNTDPLELQEIINSRRLSFPRCRLVRSGKALPPAFYNEYSHPAMGERTFSVSDFNHLPVEPNSLDALVGFDCVNHAKSYSLFCNELSRVMKKGGRIALTNWMKDRSISELVKRDPLCNALKMRNFQVDNILNLDPGLKRQFIFYDLIYQNRVVIRNDLGDDLFDSLMSEATHLDGFHGSVAHFAFTATYYP